MSDSSVTTLPDQIQISSANIPTRINESFDAASVATLFGRRASTCSGLIWGYYGGVVFIGGARTLVANGTLTLTASATNYVEVDQTGALSVNTTGPTPAKLLLYTIVAGASSVTSYTDNRSKIALCAFFFLYVAVAMANADKTMTQAQDLCATIECTGTNTADRNLITAVSRGRFVVFNNTAGGFNVIVKTASGTGVTVAPGVRALVEVDGTNVNLIANSAGGYTLPVATASTLGGVKAGAGLAVAGDGTLSASGSAPGTQSLTDFANAPGTTTGLTYGYQAGVIRSDNVTTAVAAGTVALTASATNYVEITAAGVVSANTSGFTSGRYPLATVVTGASSITTITDKRGLITVAASGVTLGAVNVFTKNQSVAPAALTSGATIAVDASQSNNFKLVLGTNATLSNPTNATDGMVLNIRIKQDATGGRTLAYGSAYKWPGGTAPALSTAANAVDLLSMYYDSTDAVWACVLQKGFA